MAKQKRAFPKHPVRIPSILIRSAQACVSNNDEFRPMLRGVRLKTDGFVESANGIVAFRAADRNHDIEPVPMDQVVMIHGKVPTSRATCEFEWHDADHGIITCIDTLKGEKKDVMVAFEVLHEVTNKDGEPDQVFPDMEKIFAVIPNIPVTTMGFDTSVLATAAKTFGSWCSCAMTFRGTHASVEIRPTSGQWNDFEASLLMMPMTSLVEDNSAPVAMVGAVESLENWKLEFDARIDATDESETELDALFDQARDIAIEERKATASYMQRRLKIGYNRAARILEQLEQNGIVSSVTRNGGREVLA